MSTPYSDLDVMAALPVAGDEVLVITGNGADTERLPWSLLSTAWVQRQAAVPTAPSYSQGDPYTVAADTEYLYFRNGTEWGRIPYEASNWDDSYNRLLRPVAPTLASAPVGSPNGHFYYDSTDEAVKFKQADAYVSLQPPQSFKTVYDGTNSATADQTGQLRVRSSDNSISAVVTGNDPTYGDVINFTVDAVNINVGDFADDGTYAANAHNHDATYAALIHDHDGVYSPVGHNHDGVYSPVGHTHTGVYSAVGHTHAASDIASGTFADARVAETNVTQHQAAINHDALTGFVANEHIDHSTVSILTAANSGLSGGGDLTADRSLAIDILNVPALATPDLSLDQILVYDQSAGGVRRVLLSTLGFDVANHSHTAAQIVSGTLLSARGGLNADASAFTGMLKMTAGVASVATAGVDYVAGSHTHLAADITDFASAVTAVTGDLSDIALNTAARHTQNTDTGTTNASFQLLTGSNGGQLRWDDATQEFRTRNHDNTAYANLRVKNLYVDGGVTDIVSNEVNIGDSVILLNSDITANGQNSDAGFDVKLLDTDNTTRRDAGFRYDTTTRRFQMTGFTPTTEAAITKTAAAKHVQTIGNNVAASYNVEHKLNTVDVVVAIIEIATGEVVLVDWAVVDADNITVSFGPSNIPDVDTHKVIVIG